MNVELNPGVAEIALPAADCVSPTTFGTVAVQGPLDTTRLIAVLAGCWLPAAGAWDATFPAETCCEHAVLCVPTVRLLPLMVLPAAAGESPTTLGTWVEFWLSTTVSFTTVVEGTEAPPAGVWVSTVPEPCFPSRRPPCTTVLCS